MDAEDRERQSIEVKGTAVHRPNDICRIEVPGPCCLIIFGASGDLANRKILPALYRLGKKGLLPEQFFVLGTARTVLDDEAFRESTREAVMNAFPQEFDEAFWAEFVKKLYYSTVDYARPDTYQTLRERYLPLEKKHATLGNRTFYLSVPPTVYEKVIANLGSLSLQDQQTGYTRIVIEKPFGRDLLSARALNTLLKRFFREDQIYRMDHYLAKETVQNILMFRFANSIFEPLWDRRYINHVEITVSETIGVGHRAGYYEKAGVIRDMFQNHIFQLLAITAMEPPAEFDAERVRDEKAKVFRSVRPFPLDRSHEFVVLGQYGEGEIDGRHAAAYRDESGVSPDSATPTFAAMRIFIDNWRWNGVPFYVRSGKRLSMRKAEIAICYKPVPHLMFAKTLGEDIDPNTLVLRVQPDEGICLVFQAKAPGSRVCMRPVVMDFCYEKELALEAYERVLLDCMEGDQMLFVREDGVELTWALLTPLIERLEAAGEDMKFPNYAAGSSGPEEAALLIGRDGRGWRPL